MARRQHRTTACRWNPQCPLQRRLVGLASTPTRLPASSSPGSYGCDGYRSSPWRRRRGRRIPSGTCGCRRSRSVALAALAATNAALAFQLRAPAPRRAVVGGVLLVDVGLLTGILYLVGGPINPFSIVYLVGITVAAVALGHRWAMALGIVSNVAYGFTFFHHRPLEFVDASASGACSPCTCTACGSRSAPRPG